LLVGPALGGRQWVRWPRAQAGEGPKPIYVYNTYTCVYYENRRSMSSIGNIVHITDASRLVILERPLNPIC
jgi:hypothetical protein